MSNETTRPLCRIVILPPHYREAELRPFIPDPAGSAVGTVVELRPKDSPVGHKILRPPTSRSPSGLRALIQAPDTLSQILTETRWGKAAALP